MCIPRGPLLGLDVSFPACSQAGRSFALLTSLLSCGIGVVVIGLTGLPLGEIDAPASGNGRSSRGPVRTQFRTFQLVLEPLRKVAANGTAMLWSDHSSFKPSKHRRDRTPRTGLLRTANSKHN
jgi:hypothetical protein